MHDAIARRLETALGLRTGRLRVGRGQRLIAYPKFTSEEKSRHKAWFDGWSTRRDLGVFVYNHWLDRKSKGLYKSHLASVRKVAGGWLAKVKGAQSLGNTPQDAAAKLTEVIATIIELADLYRSITRLPPLEGARPKRRSGAGGSYRSSPRDRDRKGLSKAPRRPAKRG